MEIPFYEDFVRIEQENYLELEKRLFRIEEKRKEKEKSIKN